MGNFLNPILWQLSHMHGARIKPMIFVWHGGSQLVTMHVWHFDDEGQIG